MIIYQDNNFKLEGIEKYGEFFLHCQVFEWKLSAFKQGLRVFAEFLNEQTKQGRKRVVTVTQNAKFAKLLGGEFHESLEHNGLQYEVYKWELKQ